jgi:hypothetical protein
MSRQLSGHHLRDISRDVPPSALRNVMADTPSALTEVPRLGVTAEAGENAFSGV